MSPADLSDKRILALRLEKGESMGDASWTIALL
jgi:hypothetical protein